ncbi:MAG: hypothetical protein IJB64_04080 [Akkermansia sp.]|nr:hypothetical protein [Akkermansia sp.]
MTEENTYPPAPEGSVRLNKFLASCGYESRRAADRLIAEGRVEVNGKAVDTPGLRVLPTDFVKVDGRHATPKEEVVVLLNKPRGYVCSRDAQGAIGTVYDLLPAKYRYANYIGRLDADSEGLLLFTNNGVLSQSIGHPKGGIEKEYWVTLDQAFDSSVLIQLLKGVRIPEGQAKAKYVSRLSARRACVVLEQGLKRQVRQMFSCLGFRVKKLVRVRIGSLWGGDLEPGHATLLDAEQIAQASTNPRRRKGLLGAKQVFKPRPQHQQEASPADEDDDYIFNLADFETEEEALESSTKFTDGEAFEPERDNGRRPFGKAPRAKRDSFDNRNGGFGRERRPFGNREGGERRGGFGGERRSFGNREGGERRGGFGGERRSFGNREGGERRGSFGGERRSFGNREGGERRGSFGGERRSFGNREDGERRGGFGGGARKSFRSFNKRRPDHR